MIEGVSLVALSATGAARRLFVLFTKRIVSRVSVQLPREQKKDQDWVGLLSFALSPPNDALRKFLGRIRLSADRALFAALTGPRVPAMR